jgi:two-component system, sensor histidine kinase
MIPQRHNDDRLPQQEAAVWKAEAQARVALLVPSIGGGLVLLTVPGYFLLRAIPDTDIQLWLLLVALALCLRAVLLYRLQRQLRLQGSDQEILLQSRSQSQLVSRYSSILLAAVVGAGLWFAGPAPGLAVSLAITAIMAFYFFAMLTLLANDFRTFAVSAPLLMLQPAAYWATADTQGGLLALALMVLLAAGICVSWRSRQNFLQRVAIRFDNDRLVKELSQAQRETLAALAQAQQANREKSIFMAATSHDLRQPLFAIQMANETMLLQDLPEQVQNLLKIQAKSITTMIKLFNNVLDLAQFDRHEMPCTIVEFNLRNIQATMAEEFTNMARDKGLKFRYDLPDVVVRSDFDLVARLLRDIISNAINYTPQGEIIVSGNVFDGQVIVSVNDTGIGIHKSEHERIFAEFVHLQTAFRTEETGLGVGLAIVKQIDDMLGLNLQLQSEPGVGSTFSFSLAESRAG